MFKLGESTIEAVDNVRAVLNLNALVGGAVLAGSVIAESGRYTETAGRGALILGANVLTSCVTMWVTHPETWPNGQNRPGQQTTVS